MLLCGVSAPSASQRLDCAWRCRSQPHETHVPGGLHLPAAVSEIEIKIIVIENEVREVEGDAHHPLNQSNQTGRPEMYQGHHILLMSSGAIVVRAYRPQDGADSSSTFEPHAADAALRSVG